VPALSA